MLISTARSLALTAKAGELLAKPATINKIEISTRKAPEGNTEQPWPDFRRPPPNRGEPRSGSAMACGHAKTYCRTYTLKE